MRNNKFKLILTFFTLTLFSFTAKINAMENKIPEEKNLENKIFENKKEDLKNQQEEEYFKLRNINRSFLNYSDICKKRISYFKQNSFEKKRIEDIKENHNKIKANMKLEKENYEKILNRDIEKDEKQKKLIKEIPFTIKETEKYINIIDEKFKNYENQNKIDKKTEFKENDLKNLKEEMEESFKLNKKYFLSYIDSISKIQPIKELKKNKLIFENSCIKTIDLIKKYDDINRCCDEFNKIKNKIDDINKCCDEFNKIKNKIDDINKCCDEFNKIKNEIEDIIESFLIFYYKTNEHVFYSFLERFKRTNPEESKIDQNFATKYNSIKDFLEVKTENIEELKIPKIESLLDELKINNFNLNNKFYLDKEKLKPIYTDARKDMLEKLKNKLKEISDEYNETRKAFLTHIVNESILKDPLNANFEINKKFLSSLNNEDYFSLYEKLRSLYKKYDYYFDFVLNYKQYNIFGLTKEELEKMKNNYLKHYLNVYEFAIDSSLKLAIDSLYEIFPQKENTNEDKDEIFSKNTIDNFFSNYENAEKNCYTLNRKILSINRHNKIEKNLREKEKNLENYTMLLRGYGKEPFLNILTENLNLKDDRKVLESLKFRAKMDSYKTKINFFLNEIKTHMCYVFNEIYINNIDKILSRELKISQNTVQSILKRQENLFEKLGFLLKECREYIYTTAKNLIVKNKEIYEEKALKKQVYSTLKFIENIEKKGFKYILENIKADLNSVNKRLEEGQEIIQKNPKNKLNDRQKLKFFLFQCGPLHINRYFDIYAKYETIYNDMDIDSLYENSIKQIEEENEKKSTK